MPFRHSFHSLPSLIARRVVRAMPRCFYAVAALLPRCYVYDAACGALCAKVRASSDAAAVPMPAYLRFQRH
jgi:hypothetical protein